MKKCFLNGLILILASLPAAALAHTTQGGHGFMDGFAHPFLGMDHLLAMLVVGVWSVLHARNVWLAPACFVSLLTVGTLLGQHGLVVPQLGPLVAISVLILGIMLVKPFKLGASVSMALIGGFAVFHGMAHGGELSTGSSVLAGIIAGSLLLHVTGMGLANFFLTSRPRLTLRFGQFVAVLGGGLVLSSVLA